MEEEKNNVLFSQDDLIEEPQNNVENGYTEELDFLQTAVNQAPAQEAQPVQPEPAPEVQPVQPEPAPEVEPVQPEVQPVQPEPVQEETPTEEAVPVAPASATGRPAINENPMGKIKLNKEEEAPVEQIDPASIKLDFKGNKNLIFVIILGILLLAVIITIPILIMNKVI